jgi:predicted amidohydrolase YtcJ
MLMADRFWGDRARYSYAWRTQLQAGARLAFGSDAPVESPNPFWGLYAAITRRRGDGTPGIQGWYSEQKLNLQEALQAYTSGPAYLANMEHKIGKISPGYLADLIVLDRDPFSCEAEQVREILPIATMVAGEWVYQS